MLNAHLSHLHLRITCTFTAPPPWPRVLAIVRLPTIGLSDFEKQAMQLLCVHLQGSWQSCCWAGLNTVAHAKPELALALPFPSTTQLLTLPGIPRHFMVTILRGALRCLILAHHRTGLHSFREHLNASYYYRPVKLHYKAGSLCA